MDEARSSSAEPAIGAGFRLDGLEVDPANGRIAGPGGVEQVDPKVMEVLVALAVRPGELATREALLDTVWPDRVVTDDVLSRCIYQLRRHLVAASGLEGFHRLIETLPRRGYRLNGEVLPDLSITGVDDRPKTAGWPRVMLLAVLLAGVAAWWAWDRAGDGQAPEVHAHVPVSIAVLPFVDLSPEGDQEYFSDGVSEELINALTRLPELRVIARSSSFWFKGQDPDIATVAEKLNVTHVLEGSVRRSDDRVRITAQLVNAEDSLHLWSETFEREFGDIFVIQDEIAVAVAEALELALGEGEREPRVDRQRHGAVQPIDPAAQHAYLRGLYNLGRFRQGGEPPETILDSIDFFEQAVAIEPEWPEAHALLAGAYHWSASSGASGEENRGDHYLRSKSAAQRAMELDDSIADAHGALGFVLHFFDHDWAGAEQAYQRAFEIEPNHTHYRWGYGLFLASAGRYEEAAATFPVAQEPLSHVLRDQLSSSFGCAGRYREAREVMRDWYAPGSEYDDWLRAAEELAQGFPESAIEILEEHVPPEISGMLITLAYAYALAGREADARGLLEELETPPMNRAAFLNRAALHAVLGETDKAVDMIESALANHTPGPLFMRCRRSLGYANLVELGELAGHPRIQAVLERIRFP